MALQGAFREHQIMLAGLGVSSAQVRKPADLHNIDALIIPGGESTTISILLADYELFDRIGLLVEKGLPVLGTCAGTILLAKEIEDSTLPSLGLMDLKVRRNAFGRQVDSFEEDLPIPVLGEEPFRAVFIRAPQITGAGQDVEVLARYNSKIVMVRQNKMLAATFHPELTADQRLHKYFLELLKAS
ncbi:MAG: Glutamine amidotransferase subunit PdxT [Desulfotomaculum sp. 46_296]|nr:MAG: Glutamine amidotransferase subunit PdxT [Desulfotomaculum sp. 46_296]